MSVTHITKRFRYKHIIQKHRILTRLESVQSLKSAYLSEFEFTCQPDRSIELKYPFVPGHSVHELVEGIELTKEGCMALRQQLKAMLCQWRESGFVHGDLSMRNLIWDGNKLTAIDWLEELKSYKGTPRYASDDVFKGKHTFESDAFAVQVIQNELSRYQRSLQ